MSDVATDHAVIPFEFDPPAKKQRTAMQQDQRLALLFGAWSGTTLAGGLFGSLLFIGTLVLPVNFQLVFETPTSAIRGASQLLGGCVAGFFMGIMWAGFIAFWMSFFSLVILAGAGVKRGKAWQASFFGGWTAFFCCGQFAWVAVVLGQIGGAWGASKQLEAVKDLQDLEAVPPSNRFGLGQMFRCLTVVCVCLGVVAFLPLSEPYLTQMGYCLAWQCATVSLVLAVSRVWRRWRK